jgi:hypothetical protein
MRKKKDLEGELSHQILKWVRIIGERKYQRVFIFFLLIVFFCLFLLQFSPLLKIRRGGKSGEIPYGCKASSGHDF